MSISPSIFKAYDARTGKKVYEHRLGTGGSFTSSPIAADGKVYVSDTDGKTHVVQAGKTFKVLAVNPLGERISASPAISGNRMIYRTDSRVFCLGE